METYSVRLTEELALLCELETIKLPGRQDGRAPSGVALIAFGIRQAAGTPARRKVDVAHMADMALWPLGLLERLFGRACAVVLSAHGSDVSLATRAGIKATLYRCYLRLGAMLLKDVQVVANSSYIGGLARDMGFPKVEVVPLGTDMTPAEAGTRSGLLFVGRIARSKGLRFLVEEVLPLLAPGTRLRVAGSIWDASERELLGRPGVDYRGALEPEQLRIEYSRALITLIPSQVPEGFGLVAIEAAACGSQVVASNAGGLTDVVTEPWGDLVDPRNPEAWAQAIARRLQRGATEAGETDATGPAPAERFDWRRTAELTHETYLRACVERVRTP